MKNTRKKIKVMTFGTFDIFHKGHRSFLKQAKKYGNHLIIVVARDRTVWKVKGKFPENNEGDRAESVKKSGLADKVILGGLGNKYAVIKKNKPDVICLGYDQRAFVEELKNRLFSFGLKNVKIARLKSYKPRIYKSSKLSRGKKQRINPARS